VILLAVTFSIIYLALSDLWWGIVIGCIVVGLAIYSMWGNIKNERNRVGEKVNKRMDDINIQLREWNQRVGAGYDVSMECGDLGAWVEMSVMLRRNA